MPIARYFACPRPDKPCTYPDCLNTSCGDLVVILRDPGGKLAEELKAARKEGKPVLIRGTGRRRS